MLTNNFRTIRLANNWIRSSCACCSERSWRTVSYFIERIGKNLLFDRDSIIFIIIIIIIITWHVLSKYNIYFFDEIVINFARINSSSDWSHSIFVEKYGLNPLFALDFNVCLLLLVQAFSQCRGIRAFLSWIIEVSRSLDSRPTIRLLAWRFS